MLKLYRYWLAHQYHFAVLDGIAWGIILGAAINLPRWL